MIIHNKIYIQYYSILIPLKVFWSVKEWGKHINHLLRKCIQVPIERKRNIGHTKKTNRLDKANISNKLNGLQSILHKN